ncbi:hypothetical protein P7C70_g1204, partial [Phenoliferia sp. Uapishka_3]
MDILRQSRPRPPGRTGSGRPTHDDAAAKATTLAIPPVDQPRILRTKLSSSSLTISLPPDSPPTKFDSLPTIDGPSLHSPETLPTDARSRTTPTHDLSPPRSIPFPSSSKAYSSSLSTSSNPLLSARARTLSARARLSDIAFAPAQDAPLLDSAWLETKSRDELAALLTEADRVINLTRRELDAAANIGKFLLDENESLRTRHDSILARTSPNKIRDKPPVSPVLASRPWRASLSATSTPHRLSSRPSIHSANELEAADDSRRSPTTPIRGDHRNRAVSSVSISSIFAATPRVSSGNGSPTPDQLATLDQANYVLHVRLTELEADAEHQEKMGKKKLKKLEKELAALRDDLMRAEVRNGVLEDNLEASQHLSGEGRAARTRRAIHLSSVSSYDTPTRSGRPQVTLDHDSDDGAPDVATPDTPTPIAPSSQPPGAQHRTPGNGASQFDAREEQEISLKRSPDVAKETLIAQLVAKIDELRDENDAIKDQRSELVERWDQAQRDLDEYRQRCEELEEIVEIEWTGRSQGAIGWKDSVSDSSRLKGNQRSIRNRGDRSVSFSSHSTSYRDGSPSPNSRRRRSASTTPSHRLNRTLGSELGREWDGGASSAASESGLVENDNDHDEDDYSNASTSTPSKTRGPLDYLLERDPSLSDLIPHGSLRYSGPPDSSTYERISKAVSDAPAVWATEDGPQAPRRGLLRSLQWTEPMEDPLWESSKYPEPDGMDESSGAVIGLIENGPTQDDEGSNEQQRWNDIRKRRYRRKSTITEDHKGSRRDRALHRLGLPAEYGQEGPEVDDNYEESPSREIVERTPREYDEDEATSEFEYLNSGEHPERGDYYPVSLRARYAPKVLATWAADSALQQVINFVLYLKLFVVLGMAVFFALWQGPKKTMGVVDRRRRLR